MKNTRDMNSGYVGYSMSIRAKEAYENGEMPISKWTKSAMLKVIEEYSEEHDVAFTMSELKKAPKSVLSNLVLTQSSWHHTSRYCNTTDFYSVDDYLLNNLTDEKIADAIASYKAKAKKEPTVKRYKGAIRYIEWGGTRLRPIAKHRELKDVNIEEKGCFFIVTDDSGKLLLKKKIDSNGTIVTNYDEEEKLKKTKKKSSKDAWEFYDSIKKNCSYSKTNHIYIRGRKPTMMDCAFGLEDFFKKGEHRLYQEPDTRILYLETWDGKQWVREE